MTMVAETEAQNTEAVTVPERSVEQQMEDMRKISEMRFKALSQLVEIHMQTLTSTMLATNGVSYLQKRQAESALREAVRFALDFGLGVTNAEIRQGGTLAKEVNSLAGVLSQALDTRMLLLADNMRQDEEKKTQESDETKID